MLWSPQRRHKALQLENGRTFNTFALFYILETNFRQTACQNMNTTETYNIGEVGRYEIDIGRGWKEVQPDPDHQLHAEGCSNTACEGCWVSPPLATFRLINSWLNNVWAIYPDAIAARVICIGGSIERRFDSPQIQVHRF
jgi:hypothetical protein